MLTMHSFQSYSTPIFLWKNSETCTWNHYPLWSARCNAQSKEAKADLTDSGPSTLYLYPMEIDTCWPERRGACKPPVTIWSPSTNRSFRKTPTVIWAKLGPICSEQSFPYMIVKRTQRRKELQKRKRGSNLVSFSTKPMSSARKDQGEWRSFFPWFPETGRKCSGLTLKWKRTQSKVNLQKTKQRTSCSTLTNPQNGMNRCKPLFWISTGEWTKHQWKTFNW